MVQTVLRMRSSFYCTASLPNSNIVDTNELFIASYSSVVGAESVSIRAWHSPLVLGIPQEIECEVHGGFPPPEITWRLNDEPYSNVIFYDSTQLWAVSVIVLTPEEKHMGVRLECRAENRNAGEYKSQFIRLDIKCRYHSKHIKFPLIASRNNICQCHKQVRPNEHKYTIIT